MVGGQRLRVGRPHVGKYVTVLIEDTVFRVLDGEVELFTHRGISDKPVIRFVAVARAKRWRGMSSVYRLRPASPGANLPKIPWDLGLLGELRRR